MVLHTISVDAVEDGQADLAPIRLWSCSASKGPRMLTSGHSLGLAILPGQGPAVAGQFTSSPEVGSSVLSNKSQEVFGLLLGVQADHLHALGFAVLSATIPVKVVSVVSPGQVVALSLPLVISLWLGCDRQSFGSSGLSSWSSWSSCWSRSCSSWSWSSWSGYSLTKLVNNE